MSEHNIGEPSLVGYAALSVNSSDPNVKQVTLVLLEVSGAKDLHELLVLLDFEENRQRIINSIREPVKIIVDANLSYRGFNSIAIEITNGVERVIFGIPFSETIINTDKFPDLKNINISVNPSLTTPIKSTLKPIGGDVPVPKITPRPQPKSAPIPLMPSPPDYHLNPPLTTPIEPTGSKTDPDPVPIVNMNNCNTVMALGILALVVVGTLIVIEVK